MEVRTDSLRSRQSPPPPLKIDKELILDVSCRRPAVRLCQKMSGDSNTPRLKINGFNPTESAFTLQKHKDRQNHGSGNRNHKRLAPASLSGQSSFFTGSRCL